MVLVLGMALVLVLALVLAHTYILTSRAKAIVWSQLLSADLFGWLG